MPAILRAVYAPRLRFYQLLWRTKSFTVREIAPHVDGLSPQPGEIVVTCDPRYMEQVRTNGAEIAAVGGCVSMRL